MFIKKYWPPRVRLCLWVAGMLGLGILVLIGLPFLRPHEVMTGDSHQGQSQAVPGKTEPAAPSSAGVSLTWDMTRPREELDRVLADGSIPLPSRFDLAKRAESHYRRAGRGQEAQNLLAKAADLLTEMEDAHAGQLFLATRLRRDESNPQKADECLGLWMKVAAFCPEGALAAEAWMNQGRILDTDLRSHSQPEQVAECFRQAVLADAGSEFGREAGCRLLRKLRHKKRYEEGEKVYQQVLAKRVGRSSPWAAQVMLEMAETYQQSDRLDEAKATYKQAIADYAGTEISRIARTRLSKLQNQLHKGE